MGLEAATFINSLNAANPPGTDSKSQGDDHLRLIKSTLKNTFPLAAAALKFGSVDAGNTDVLPLTLYRDSPTAVANDLICSFVLAGNNVGTNEKPYVRLQGQIVDPTNTSEDGRLLIKTMVAGAEATVASFDGTGLNVVGALSAGTFTGPISVTGSLSSTGSMFATNSFISQSSNVNLAPGSSGSIHLMPSGVGSGTGQVIITSTGDITTSRDVTVGLSLMANGFVEANSTFKTNTATCILGTDDATIGNVFLRPRGHDVSTNQMSVASTGNVAIAGNATIGGDLTVTGSNVNSGSINLILSNTAGAGGGVTLKPNGSASTDGQWLFSETGIAFGEGIQSSLPQLILATTGDSTNATIYLRPYSNTNTFAQAYVSGIAGQVGNLYLTAGTGLKPGGGAWADSSDIRIKNVVGDYTRGLEAIKGLVPIYYTFKGNDSQFPDSGPEAYSIPDPNSSHYQAAVDGTQFAGFIAQDVQSVMPEMVKSVSGYIDGQPVNDLLTLDTSSLVFALVNAVKDLATRVETLENA